jgi:GAF domain-containing protein
MMCRMDVGAINAAAAASAASYRSFADATRSVLDLLERLMPGTALYLAHLDRTHAVHRIVDTRGGAELGLRSNLATPLADSYDLAMAEERAPRLCNDLSADPVYAEVGMQRRAGAGSYLGVPLELSDGARVGSLAALSEQAARFRPDDEQLFTMLARVLAYELARESNERDL